MTLPPEVANRSRRRLRKFLARSGSELGQPIVALRHEDGDIPLAELTWTATDGDNWKLTGIESMVLDKRMVDSTIVECRVFFAEREDCYLPGVVDALRTLLTDEQRGARQPLKDLVASVVTGGRIGASGPIFHAGRLEMDNGFGPGKLLGSDVIAMDYIYGVALHEDDDRLARVKNVGMETALQAVVYHFNDLLHAVTYVREQLVHDLAQGYLAIEAE
ncbi:hypothetical protein LGT39_05960 [Demequina sp. TTPB684]|uniref:hypothetical protein n=1 Tax=unclassified Demequina TaxID=2620311 RepID=UPI001CF21CB8|nr:MULTISPECIES: hypothetical protein [unclassified Demequina]MCB2412393.1 hypothetical protein [Demequina sp. TTPB684]UPU89523.1 hypothetical protein LGT36_006235 [Demequina sp. TMPB413]